MGVNSLAGRRISKHPISALVVLVACSSLPAGVSAQLLERALVVEGARIVCSPDKVIEKGSLIIKGGRVKALGEKVDVPFFAKRYDASGKTITVGLIDSWSGLGASPASSKSEATGNAWDGFDRYAVDASRSALRHGVTTVYLGAGGGTGIVGTGSIVKLAPDGGGIGRVVVPESAICVDLGSGTGPVSRLKTFRSVRKSFREALDHRQSIEDYEEDLKEYEEKLAERRKKKEEEKKEEAGDDEDEEEESPDDEKEDDGEEEKQEPEDKPEPEGEGRELFGADNGDSDKKGDSKEEGDKKEDELTKPERPTPNRVAELLVRAIDHELKVRITADRSADILNALALAEEFNLDILLEGATDGYLLASQIEDVPVFLGRSSRGTVHRNDAYRRHWENGPSILESAGVPWTVGSGGEDVLSTRHVGLNAQIAARSTRDANLWLELVTRRAAKLLGLPDSYGVIQRGQAADLVIWSSDPANGGARVERVYIDGKLAYDALAYEGSGS